ncbi:MAG: DUF374 domain-containing protein [Planctomycetes bacterium]|nr:DUF374 domain-containing protein [Planctomycetota bacterium]
MNEPRKRRSLARRIRKTFTRPLSSFVSAVVPILYIFYMNLVWRTSKVEMFGVAGMVETRRRHGGIVQVLWHETVFFVAYAFRELSGSTLASKSDFGQLITNMLERCNFVVLRGGSSKKGRRTGILRELIDHMRTYRDVSYGITVDGSRGPCHVMKPGALAIARATGTPLYRVHVSCRPNLRAPTWDRTIIPLPFSRITILFEGPTFCPADVSNAEFERIRVDLETALETTRARAEAHSDGAHLDPELDNRRTGGLLLRPGEFLTPIRRSPAIAVL